MEQIIISGYRFSDHISSSKVLGKDILSTLERREHRSTLPKQESYDRLSIAIPTDNGEYKDGNSVMNMVINER